MMPRQKGRESFSLALRSHFLNQSNLLQNKKALIVINIFHKSNLADHKQKKR